MFFPKLILLRRPLLFHSQFRPDTSAEGQQLMNKLRYFLLGLIYFPFAIVWALSYGIIAGVYFKIIANWEDFLVISNKEIRQWKRYSKRAYEQYINAKVSEKKAKAYEIPHIRESIKAENSHQPFPTYNIFINFIVAIILLPFRALTGLVEGPLIVFKDAKTFWNIKIKKIDPQKYYQELLVNQEKKG